MTLWTCQYRGCKSSAQQLDALRKRKSTGFPHDEDPSIRVCTVCRRLELGQQSSLDQSDGESASSEVQLDMLEVDPADEIPLLAGLREDLLAVENQTTRIQELVEVIRYFKKDHALNIIVLWKRCMLRVPVEKMIVLLTIMDDVLLLEDDADFRAMLSLEAHTAALHAYKMLPDKDKATVVRMVGVWKIIGVFDSRGQKWVDKISIDVDLDSDDEKLGVEIKEDNEHDKSSRKRRRIDVQKKARSQKEEILRILRVSDDPLDVFDLNLAQLTPEAVRKAFRRMVLAIHPDKIRDDTIDSKMAKQAFEKVQVAHPKVKKLANDSITIESHRGDAVVHEVPLELQCRFPGCHEEACPNKKCSNGCCPLLIKHCQTLPGRRLCYFHPPLAKR